MSTPFPEQVAPGGILVFPQIQSPNYVSNTSGWSIMSNGSAQFNNLTIRGTFNGTDFIINSAGIFLYSGTPATGNLVGSWASVAGTDAFSNAYNAGLQVGSQLQLNPNVNSVFDITNQITGILIAATELFTADTNQKLPGFLGSVTLNTGAATKMATLLSSPLAATPATAAAIVLESENDGATDTAVSTFGIVTTPDNSTVVFTPIMTLTPYALLLYGVSSGQVVVTKTSGSGTIPIPAGVTSAKGECWGAAGGSTGNGAGVGGNGGNSTLTGSAVTVTAHGSAGQVGTGEGGLAGPGGTGSANTVHNNGGQGSASKITTGTPGGGGGSSAGPASAGNNGGTPSGGAAVPGGAAGGNGAANSSVSGAAGSAPGGAGGSGVTGLAAGGGEYAAEPALVVSSAGVAYVVGAGGAGDTSGPGISFGGSGAAGQVRLTYSTGNPLLMFSIASAAGTDQFGNAYPKGAWAATNGDFFYSSATAPAAGNLVGAAAGISGTDSYSNAYAAGYTGTVVAFQPSSSPTVVETWHNVTPPSGWSGICRYKKLAEANMICIDFQLNNAGSGAVAVTIMTLPAGYIPATTHWEPMVITNNTAPTNVLIRCIVAPSTGIVSTETLVANTTNLNSTFMCPLD